MANDRRTAAGDSVVSHGAKRFVCDVIALGVYRPLARLASRRERRGRDVSMLQKMMKDAGLTDIRFTPKDPTDALLE